MASQSVVICDDLSGFCRCGIENASVLAALTLDNPGVLPPALSSARAAAAVLVVAVAAVLPLYVPTSCFDLVQRSQFGNGFALQQLAVKDREISFPSHTEISNVDLI